MEWPRLVRTVSMTGYAAKVLFASAIAIAAITDADARILDVPVPIPTIEAALLGAMPHDTIRVAAGAVVDVPNDLSINVHALTLLSGDPKALLRNLSHSGISTIVINADSCRIEGFAMYCASGSVIRILASASGTSTQGNEIYAAAAFGGVGVYDSGVSTRVEGNIFHYGANAVWAGGTRTVIEANEFPDGVRAIAVGGDAVIRGNKIRGQQATSDYGSPGIGAGILVYDTDGPVEIVDNQLSDNLVDGWFPDEGPGFGGAIAIHASRNVRVERNWIGRNQARRGAGLHARDSDVTVRENLFVANHDSVHFLPDTSDGYGGGMLFENCSGIVEGNTIVRNRGISDGGAVRIESSTGLTFRNNIIADNVSAGAAISVDEFSAPTFSCNDVWDNLAAAYGGWPDPTGIDGNIALDPLFCSEDSSGYRLNSASPCLPIWNPECGLIGAFGVGCPTASAPLPAGVSSLLEIGPNPASEYTLIRFVNGVRGRAVDMLDPSGRRVRRLTTGSGKGVVWDLHDDAGHRLPSGVYFARATGVGRVTPIRVIVTR